MASVKSGSFTLSGAGKVATNTQAVTGIGFQPDAVIFFWNGETAGSWNSNIHSYFGYGFTTGAAENYAVTQYTQGGVDPFQHRSGVYNNGCIVFIDHWAGTKQRVDVQSLDADGFTLEWQDVDGPYDVSVGYLAIAGYGAVKGSYITAPTSTGTQAYTGVGFQPSAVLFLSNANTGFTADDWGSPQYHGYSMIGFTDGTTEGVATFFNKGGAGTQVSYEYAAGYECIAQAKEGWVDTRATHSAWGADGFTLNWLEAATAYVIPYLAIEGPGIEVIEGLTLTSVTTQALSVTNSPLGLLSISNHKVENTQDVGTGESGHSVGSASSDGTDMVVWWFMTGGSGLSRVHRGFYNTASIASSYYTAGSHPIDGVADMSAWGAASITYNQTDACYSAHWFGMLVFEISDITINLGGSPINAITKSSGPSAILAVIPQIVAYAVTSSSWAGSLIKTVSQRIATAVASTIAPTIGLVYPIWRVVMRRNTMSDLDKRDTSANALKRNTNSEMDIYGSK